MNLNERLNYLGMLEYLTLNKDEKVSSSNKDASERYVRLKKQYPNINTYLFNNNVNVARQLKNTSRSNQQLYNSIRNTQFTNLPVNLQKKIFTMAANTPKSAFTIGAVSKNARNATKYKRAAALINKGRIKYLQSSKTLNEVKNKNIPFKLLKLALGMKNKKGIGALYKERQEHMKKFRNLQQHEVPQVNNGFVRYYVNSAWNPRHHYFEEYYYQVENGKIYFIHDRFYQGGRGFSNRRYIGKI